VREARHPAVDRQPLVHVGHIVFADAQAHTQADRGSRVILELLALQLADRVLEQLDVHVEADGVDMPALLAAQQVPAPRISRSSAATRKPLPRSLNSLMAASRFFATEDNDSWGGVSRYA
jgi:hypothetical protein